MKNFSFILAAIMFLAFSNVMAFEIQSSQSTDGKKYYTPSFPSPIVDIETEGYHPELDECDDDCRWCNIDFPEDCPIILPPRPPCKERCVYPINHLPDNYSGPLNLNNGVKY